MGTYAEYSGTLSIPEEKREQFTAHMLKLLNYGGMMQFETVRLYGLELYLLKPVRELTDGKVSFHYNTGSCCGRCRITRMKQIPTRS